MTTNQNLGKEGSPSRRLMMQWSESRKEAAGKTPLLTPRTTVRVATWNVRTMYETLQERWNTTRSECRDWVRQGSYNQDSWGFHLENSCCTQDTSRMDPPPPPHPPSPPLLRVWPWCWHGVAHKVDGFVSLLSSEMSGLIICVIAFDPFIAVWFPLLCIWLQRSSAQLRCLSQHTMGLVLAVVPLVQADWPLCSQTTICISPTRHLTTFFSGQDYTFAVMIIFNFVLYLFIAASQLVVDMAIRSQSKTKQDDNDRRSNDLAITQRLSIVMVAAFFCWFPIDLPSLVKSTLPWSSLCCLSTLH